MRVLIADDHGIVREGLRALLMSLPDCEVVGEVSNGRDAVRMCRELNPDLVIMDVVMPDLNGIEATRQIKDTNPRTQVIGLSMHAGKQYVLQMLEAGAVGYILKESLFNELVMAITAIRRHQVYISPAVGSVVTDGLRRRDSGQEPGDRAPVTPREREVLQLLAEGKNSIQIADKLHISPRTVDTHRRNIMQKLDLHNLAELTKYAIRMGLTSTD